MPADKAKEEVKEEIPEAVMVKQEEKPESMVRERAVGSGASLFPVLAIL